MQIQDKNANRRLVIILSALCFLLELGIAPNISFGNGSINYALIYTSCIALIFGGRAGVIAGFVSGLIFDLSTTGPVGLMALLLTGTAYVLGIEVRNRLLEDTRISMRNHAIACLIVSSIYNLLGLIAGETASFSDAFVMRALPSAALTFIAFLPFVFVLSRRGSRGPDLSGSSQVLKSPRGMR